MLFSNGQDMDLVNPRCVHSLTFLSTSSFPGLEQQLGLKVHPFPAAPLQHPGPSAGLACLPAASGHLRVSYEVLCPFPSLHGLPLSFLKVLTVCIYAQATSKPNVGFIMYIIFFVYFLNPAVMGYIVNMAQGWGRGPQGLAPAPKKKKRKKKKKKN